MADFAARPNIVHSRRVREAREHQTGTGSITGTAGVEGHAGHHIPFPKKQHLLSARSIPDLQPLRFRQSKALPTGTERQACWEKSSPIPPQLSAAVNIPNSNAFIYCNRCEPFPVWSVREVGQAGGCRESAQLLVFFDVPEAHYTRSFRSGGGGHCKEAPVREKGSAIRQRAGGPPNTRMSSPF